MPAIPTLHLWPDDDPQQVRWWSPMATARVPVAALPAPARAGEPEGETCALGRLLPEAALQALGDGACRLVLDAGLPAAWQAFAWEWTRDARGLPWAGRLLAERCAPPEAAPPAAHGDGLWLLDLWPRQENVQPFTDLHRCWRIQARKRATAEQVLRHGLNGLPPPAALALIAHGSETADGPALRDPDGQPWQPPLPQPAPALVVLAACAGRDGNLIAEGRRWLKSGARSVLVPLGRLDARTCAAFLEALGAGLAAGESPGAILRRLQPDSAQQHGAARFVLLGDSGDGDDHGPAGALIALTRRAWCPPQKPDSVFEALRRQRGLPGHYADTDAGRALLDELWPLAARLPPLVRSWVLALCAWLAEHHDHSRLDACQRLRRQCDTDLPEAAVQRALWAKLPYRQGDYARALIELDAALALDAQHVGALGLYANCLLDLDLPEAASQVLDRRDDALSRLSDASASLEQHRQLDMRARLYLRCGRLTAAGELFRRKHTAALQHDGRGFRELAWRLYTAAWQAQPDAAGAGLVAQAQAALAQSSGTGHGNEDGHYLLRALAAWAWRRNDAGLIAQTAAALRQRWSETRSEGGPLGLACGFLYLHDRHAYGDDWERARAALETERYFLELAALHGLAGERPAAQHMLNRFRERREAALRSLGDAALVQACAARDACEQAVLTDAAADPARLVASGLLPV